MSKSKTINIPCGYELTLTTDEFSSGNYYYLATPGVQGSDTGTLAVSSVATVGPFNEDRFYDIVSLTGEIQTSLEFSGNYTAADEDNAGSFDIALNMILR